MATFYENSFIRKGCHPPLWCRLGIVWNYVWKPQKTPQTCSSSGFCFWNLSTLWHISLVMTASTYSTVCLWLRCIMVVYHTAGEETVRTWHGPFDSDEGKPVSDRWCGESTLCTSSHRCVGIPPCDFTSLRTQQYQKQQKHDAELNV